MAHEDEGQLFDESGAPASAAAAIVCARCGHVLGSEAFACTECGLPVVPRMTAAWRPRSRSGGHREAAAAAPEPAAAPVPEPAPAPEAEAELRRELAEALAEAPAPESEAAPEPEPAEPVVAAIRRVRPMRAVSAGFAQEPRTTSADYAPASPRRKGAGLPDIPLPAPVAGAPRLTPRQRVVRAVPLGPAMIRRREERSAMLIAMHLLAVTGVIGLSIGMFLLGRLQ